VPAHRPLAERLPERGVDRLHRLDRDVQPDVIELSEADARADLPAEERDQLPELLLRERSITAQAARLPVQIHGHGLRIAVGAEAADRSCIEAVAEERPCGRAPRRSMPPPGGGERASEVNQSAHGHE
jgi:hypothetical protein